jgi:uncharacterized protein (TIGR02246 family)
MVPGYSMRSTEEETLMKSLAVVCVTALTAFSMMACKTAPASSPDMHEADVMAIHDVEVQANKGWAAKNIDAIANFYADDAVLMTPGAESIQGKDAIRNGLKEMIADPALSLTFEASRTDVAKSGDLGYTQGSYKMTVTDPATHKVINDHGNYVTTFRKQADGSWKAVADIATSAVPPMPPPKRK